MGTDSAGRAPTPPVVGNQTPQMMVKPQSDARPAGLTVTPAAPGTKHPKEEVLKNAYKQIQSGAITSPDVIRSIAANFYFFSSRRRHTRFDCDWSSDVCSSD